MNPSSRKALLFLHVTSSMGWAGALAVFLAHAVAAAQAQDPFVVRAAALAMGVTAWFVILPFSLASLVTGIVQAVGTAWGLLRHYWVVFKLVLTVIATAVLLMKMAPITEFADAARAVSFDPAQFGGLGNSLLIHAIGGLVILLVAAALAIFKPRGRIVAAQWRWSTMPGWVRVAVFATGVLVLALGIMVAGGHHGPGMHMHG